VGLRSRYADFNKAVQSLYGDSMQLANDAPFSFDDAAFEDAAGLVYDSGGFNISQFADPKVRKLIAETLRIIDTAISGSLPHEVPDTVRHALENNAFIFSGFKTYHSLREVGLSLTTDGGDIKPYRDFLGDVRRINATYNHNYLYAEYNHAVGASLMAAKWQDFERDGDRYDLQYRTAGDNRVREEHAILNGTTLPPSDPFWTEYLPPNGWNCRCTAVQVRKGKYPTSDPELAKTRGDNCTEGEKRKIFRFNAGKSLQLFPPKHPYYKATQDAKQAITQATKEVKTAQDAVDFINEAEERKKWFERGFSQLIETNKRGVNGYTDMNGLIAMRGDRFNRVIAGLNKVKRGQDLSFEEADALATLWHEITHNRNKKGNMRLTNPQTRYMEMANEFVARKTLPEFYTRLGGKMQHPEFMENRDSTGYNDWVLHYDTIIKETGAKAEDVLTAVRKHLFEGSYDDQATGLVNALYTAGAKKKDGKTALKKTELKKLVRSCFDYDATFKNTLKSLIEN